MGCMRALFKSIAAIVVAGLAILFGPNTLPENVEFTEFEVAPLRDLGKNFVPNNLLDNVERLFENEIKGPEGFAVLNGDLYTTLHGGYVVKVYEDQVTPVVKFGEPCVGWRDENKCGRPLGLKAIGNNHLVVADCYYGIFKYNVNDRTVAQIVEKEVVIDGRKAKSFNSVDVGRDGTIYWSHSSSDFSIEDGVYAMLADGSGRLIKYDPRTKKNTVLIKDLHFANGVALSPDEDFVLVAETGRSRIHKYFLKGPRKSTSEIFIDGLPGVPDNLRPVGRDRLFVPLVLVGNEKNPILFQTISHLPMLRKFFARFMSLVELSLTKIDRIYPNEFVKNGLHYVGHFETFSWLWPVNTTLLELDWDGNVVRNYQGSDGSFSGLSDVMIHNGYLYLGSPTNNYLGRIKLTKLGEKIPVESAPRTNTRPPPPPSTTARTTTRQPPPPSTTARTTTRSPPPPPTTTRPTPSPSKQSSRPAS